MKKGGGNRLSPGLPVLCPAPAPCTPAVSVSNPTTCPGNTQTPSRPSNQGSWSTDPRLPPSKTRALPLCVRLLSHGRLQPARLRYPWGFPARILWWLPFPSPGALPDLGIEPRSPALSGRFFTRAPLLHRGQLSTQPPRSPKSREQQEPAMPCWAPPSSRRSPVPCKPAQGLLQTICRPLSYTSQGGWK